MPDGSVRAQLLARVDEFSGRMAELLEEVRTVTEQLHPERARSCRNAITMASVMVERDPAAGPCPPAHQRRRLTRDPGLSYRPSA
jgi:hypothetical protein